MFDAIGSGDHVAPRELVGHLLILQPVTFESQVPTEYGPADAVGLDLVDLDADGEPAVWRDQRWFNKVIVSSLRARIGGLVLARIGVGTAKNPKQDPPFVLVDASADAVAVARAQTWMTTNPGFTVGAASSTPRPPVGAAPAPAAMVAQHTTTLPTAPAPAAPTAAPSISPDVAALIAQLQNTKG